MFKDTNWYPAKIHWYDPSSGEGVIKLPETPYEKHGAIYVYMPLAVASNPELLSNLDKEYVKPTLSQSYSLEVQVAKDFNWIQIYKLKETI